MAASGKILGIDLGTTNSCMAVIHAGELRVLPNREGSKTTPSVVSFSRDGRSVVGLAAKRQSAASPETTIYSIKRFMGMKFNDPAVQRDRDLMPYQLIPAENGDAWVESQGRKYSPPEISAQVLTKLKSDAEAYLNEPVDKAVITVPAYFNDAQRQATKDAGKIAGLEVLRIINEPTAASLACGLDLGKRVNVAVYDLGGGTFDITLLQLNKGVFDVKATHGDTHLGGDDFDQAIIRWLLDEFKSAEGIDLSGDKLALSRLKEAAEQAKIELSLAVQAEVNLPFVAQAEGGPRHLVMSLTREKFEELVKALVEATLKPCEAALKDAGLAKAQVDEIVLVGGMTRMPAVREAVRAFFGKEPHIGVDPDEAIAVGAAIQGGILKGEVRDKLLLDVTPLSLGVRVAGGLFSKLIEKNTTIPTRASSVYTTANDNQTSVRINVYQGEKPLAAENMFLGDFELINIPPAPRGEPKIEVTFDIDANGILRVKALDVETKRQQQIKIEPSSGLSEDQISKMVNEAQQASEVNKASPPKSQFLVTCQKLIDESKREIEEFQIPMHERQPLLAELEEFRGRLNDDVEAMKELLKQLNTFLIKLRVRRQPASPPAAN